MNALEVLIPVMIMQIATTLKGVTPALAMLDTSIKDGTFVLRLTKELRRR